MPSVGRRIVEHVCLFPGQSELEIAKAVIGPHALQPQVNAEIRRLVALGMLRRDQSLRPTRVYLASGVATALTHTEIVPPSSTPLGLSEDEIKNVLRSWLEGDGWLTVVKMGHERGIDIEARRGHERWIIEVKGPGSRQPMRVNYFLAMLGETLQRMDDPNARYSIALPDLPQFRGLWARLPALAKQRTTIDALFVAADSTVTFIS